MYDKTIIDVIKGNRLLYKIALVLQNIKNRIFTTQIRGKNNIIKKYGLATSCNYNIDGDNNTIDLGVTSNVSCLNIFIKGNNNRIYVGENVIYKKGSIWIEGNNLQLTIGCKTTIELAHFLLTGNKNKVELGEDCMLSTNIVFRTGDSHSIIDLETGLRINYEKSICVSDHVWIGADCRVLKGASIGTSSIIGASSLVSTKIPSNCIAAGVSASVIRSNVTWSRERL